MPSKPVRITLQLSKKLAMAALGGETWYATSNEDLEQRGEEAWEGER
jgi:hypothetical protein